MAGVQPETELGTIIAIEGRVGEADQALIASFLGRLGYTAAITSQTLEEAVSPQPEELAGDSSFTSVTDPNSILLREHVEDFAAQHGLPTRNFIRSFHAMMDGDNQTRLFVLSRGNTPPFMQNREPQPLPGVSIVKRHEAGLMPYVATASNPITNKDARIMLQYGIVAGSITSRENPDLLSNASKLKKVGGATLLALAQLTRELEKQLSY